MVNKFILLEPFLEDLTKTLTLSDLEDHFNKPHQTLRKYLDILVKEKILKENKGKRLRTYRINRSPLLKNYIVVCEHYRFLQFLENKKMHYLAEVLLKLNAKILIFGSAAISSDYKDIDILIISRNKKILQKTDEISMVFPKKLHFVYSDGKISDDFFKNELRKKHILLNSHDYFVDELYGFKD